MISIDRISFEFAMNDESFAHNLYAEWDSFCRTCFENIVEECLSVYDKERVLHEIEKLDLDLGSILQENFYSEFPQRLREELLKALPSLQFEEADREELKTAASRFANLLYYLEHGVLKTEWADVDFNLSEELDELMMQDKRYLEKIAGLCMTNEYILRRLLLQTDNDTSLVHLYSIAMDQTFSVKNEKRRFMEIFLEIQPDLPVRFVHEVEEDGRLRGMAELLDTRSVRRMMEKEAEEHAEVDLPPYWHYLYEWLIKYYPFNGVAIFGGKSDFISHLHYRLLTFIHKRSHTFYLSKEELTASFLLEVFGATYYKQVLNTIYNMQPRNADGSPTYDGYYNRELYRIFIQLSLLNLPGTSGNVTDVNVPTKDTDSLLADFKMEALNSILKDAGRNEIDKRMIVATLVREKPEELIGWLRREVIRLLKSRTKGTGWLYRIPDEQLSFTVRKVVLLWISGNRQNLPMQEMFREILLLVYSEATGRNKDEMDMEELAMLLSHTDDANLMTILTGLMDERTLKQLLASKSLTAMETVDESTKSLLQLIHKGVIGKNNETTVDEWTEELHLSENEAKNLRTLIGQDNNEIKESIRRLRMLLASGNIAEAVKRRLIIEVIDLLSSTGTSRVRHAMSVFEQWLQNIRMYSNTAQVLLQSHWHTSGGFMEWMKDTGITIEFKHELVQTLAREKPQELIGILRNLPHDEETASFMVAHLSTETLLDVALKTDAKQGLLLSQTIDLLQREQGRFAFLSNMRMSFATALSEAFLLFMQDNDTLGGRNMTEQEVVGKFLACLYYVNTRKTDYQDNAEWKHLQDEVTNGIGLNGTETVLISEDTISERLLSEYGSLNEAELYVLIISLLNKQPEQFIGLFENKVNTDFIKRISGIADRAMLSRILLVLSFANGFEHRAAFGRLMEWLSTVFVDYTSASDMVSVLLSWINTMDWKRQNIRQMTLFFISRLYGSDGTAKLPLEMLTDNTLPEEVRKQLFRNYMHSRPKELLSHMQQLVAEGRLPMDKWAEWAEWADLSEWLRLVASVSLTLEELLRQIIECLLYQRKSINETALRYGLTIFIATNDAAKFAYYINKEEIVRSFVQSLPVVQEKKEEKMEEKKEEKMEETINQVMKDLNMMPAEERLLEKNEENEQEIAFVGNAGLCLLSPWFPRLFSMLGYLDEEKRNFKDTASKIRAVFLLQYLANPEERDYREPELAFNRLLVALPAHIPLPKRIELTDEEKRTSDGMLEGVKVNWAKMNGTSVSGFRQSFIVRNGQLEKQDEKWLLTVESRAYDILLESIPWAFRQIRFPWLKKYIQVFWHEKQEF